ncbi:hypothetical protein E2C01_036276 [Portunus trituberculatus]|uniref:Uncharacterized protein n=1 Tax=Portunus trituberculatus TaxID=210409 RepID=A0A5B7FBM9_PORTR|nr:hypothetical protein [Portunus trituberculatus]
MPLKHQPSSLQEASMVSIARNFDYICYHAKTREEMCAMIYDESYLKVAGPFLQLREYLCVPVCVYVQFSSGINDILSPSHSLHDAVLLLRHLHDSTTTPLRLHYDPKLPVHPPRYLYDPKLPQNFPIKSHDPKTPQHTLHDSSTTSNSPKLTRHKPHDPKPPSYTLHNPQTPPKPRPNSHQKPHYPKNTSTNPSRRQHPKNYP